MTNGEWIPGREVDDLQELFDDIHRLARDKGWWDNGVNIPEKVALIHSEVSEFLTAVRKEWGAHDDHCPEFTKAEIELADVIIRCADLAGGMSFHRLAAAIRAKHEYNRQRDHRHGGLPF